MTASRAFGLDDVQASRACEAALLLHLAEASVRSLSRGTSWAARPRERERVELDLGAGCLTHPPCQMPACRRKSITSLAQRSGSSSKRK